MKVVADSFSWPFRGDWKSAWVPGAIAIALMPIAFIPLIGYAIAATRAAQTDAAAGPPRWALSTRLLSDGFWTSLSVIVLTAPFALAINPFAQSVYDAHLWNVSDVPLSQLYAHVVATSLLALPWGLLLLLHMPHATARFARTGNPQNYIDFPASINAVKTEFATWNLAAAAIVTGWAVGLAGVGLLCAGLVPGLFYAILVSAHATAVLEPKGKNPRAR